MLEILLFLSNLLLLAVVHGSRPAIGGFPAVDGVLAIASIALILASLF
jgi:hypothetical protein